MRDGKKESKTEKKTERTSGISRQDAVRERSRCTLPLPLSRALRARDTRKTVLFSASISHAVQNNGGSLESEQQERLGMAKRRLLREKKRFFKRFSREEDSSRSYRGLISFKS